MKENPFFHSDLKIVLVVIIPVSLECFTCFLIGLIDLDDSTIFIFLSIFQKIHKCQKMLFQKIKPVISSCFLYIKEKIIKKLSILQVFI